MQAYTLLQHSVYRHTWLLYGRHLDQLLLCCLYSTCKVGGWVVGRAVLAACLLAARLLAACPPACWGARRLLEPAC